MGELSVDRTALHRWVCRVAAVALVAGSAGLGLPAPARAASITSTVTMVGETGDFIAGGTKAYFWRTGLDDIDVSAGPTAIEVFAKDPSYTDYFRFTFAPAKGETFATGVYAGAERTPFRADGKPGISIFGSGRGCNEVAGSFEILEMSQDLSRLWIVFEHHCESATAPAAFGEIRINMPADPDLLVAPTRVDWPERTVFSAGRSVPVTLVNTGSSEVTVSTPVLSGPAAADHSVEANTCETLMPGSRCVVTVSQRAQSSGPRTAQLSLATSARGAPFLVDLSGEGLIDPAFADTVGVPPDPVGTPAFTATLDELVLTWQNPASVDFTETVIRQAVGRVPPATITDGEQVYAGRDSTTTLTGLDPITYSYSLFARDVEGLVAEPATLTVAAARITLASSRSSVVYGEAVKLSGTLTDAVTGEPLVFREVRILAYDPVTDEIFEAGLEQSGLDGKFSLKVTPDRTYEYVAIFPGDDKGIGGFSTPKTIPVKASVVLLPVKKKGKLGTAFVLVGAADPLSVSVPYVLERLVKGKWKSVEKRSPNREGITKFKVKPASKGKHTYRVRRGAVPGAKAGTSKPVTLTVT
ncbi:MAG: hypothetical protein ACT4P1_10335 [Sporichthyaceae bacterium]